MKVDQFIAKLRVRLNDPIRTIAADQLFKTDELVDCAQEVINEFARVVEYFKDSTTAEICRVPVITGQNWVSIDERIIRIRRAKLDGSITQLGVIDSRNEDAQFPNWDSTTNQGTPRMIMLGEELDKVFFNRTPIADSVMSLAVTRYPLLPVKTGEEMGIPDRYCLKLLPGARSLAYSKQDGDTMDAGKHLKLDLEFQAELMKIKHEIKKKTRHPRQVKYRDY